MPEKLKGAFYGLFMNNVQRKVPIIQPYMAELYVHTLMQKDAQYVSKPEQSIH